MDELQPLSHRFTGGVVVGLFAGEPGHAVACFFQLGEQHLLVAQAISKQLLIQLAHRWLAAFKQLACFQLLPPRSDHWADRKQRQLARCDQAGWHGHVDPVQPWLNSADLHAQFGEELHHLDQSCALFDGSIVVF